MKQLQLDLHKGKHGGRRPGSGRKRIHSNGVAHRVREKVQLRTPLHINFKVKAFIKNKQCLKILKRAILNARKLGLFINHYSLQSNHIHLIVEATDNETLTMGMRSITITFAKNLNKGRNQEERYHRHVMRTLREVKNAVHYVLFNEQKHRNLKKAYVDSYSSLQFCKQLGNLAKEVKTMIIRRDRNTELNFMDPARSWLQKKALPS